MEGIGILSTLEDGIPKWGPEGVGFKVFWKRHKFRGYYGYRR